ncbi:hypothetical protein BN2497_3395 [Janthinobacterium sp. CG23_2]|nr:hypothetical protein BN2497_3395 [Janthinobacterium sp. CG23_2]CUU28095.1 hypothetical protein BN3177_3395 [Janthinobacterium sp. CG23_2]
MIALNESLAHAHYDGVSRPCRSPAKTKGPPCTRCQRSLPPSARWSS